MHVKKSLKKCIDKSYGGEGGNNFLRKQTAQTSLPPLLLLICRITNGDLLTILKIFSHRANKMGF